MPKQTHKISNEVKKQIIERVKQGGVPVPDIAAEHGIHVSTIYSWLTKGVKAPPSILELAKLKRENQQLLGLVGKLTVELSTPKKKNAGY